MLEVHLGNLGNKVQTAQFQETKPATIVCTYIRIIFI